MTRRLLFVLMLAGTMVFVASCHHSKVQNPIANVTSAQPDKVLFDRAMEAMKHGKYDVARLTLQTMINTYPDSEYVARAKLAVGDSWYAEGGSTGLAQAEIEYKDFITFFPNMPEAAEAQLKVANIHYRQMEKPDRDFTHAKRAEDEYRQLILQFPDSKLVPEAKQRLLEVQEVLAEREFRVGRFYYLRGSYPAAIARLKSLVDASPLYSQADEALYLLGNAYEKQIEEMRASRLPEAAKGKLIQKFTEQAAEAYGRIITRYPVMERAKDAAKRLEALHHPVPTPTPEALAQNKAEEASRYETGRFGKLMMNFRRRPGVAQATKVGEPTLVSPKPTSATDLARDATMTAMEASRAAAPARSGAGEHAVAVETVGTGTGTPVPGQPTPAPGLSGPPAAPGGDRSIPELKPESAPQPPTQVNEAAREENAGDKAKAENASQSKDQQPTDDKDKDSSSRTKKKKGIRKIVPF